MHLDKINVEKEKNRYAIHSVKRLSDNANRLFPAQSEVAKSNRDRAKQMELYERILNLMIPATKIQEFEDGTFQLQRSLSLDIFLYAICVDDFIYSIAFKKAKILGENEHGQPVAKLVLNNTTGPAFISFHDPGKVKHIKYLSNGIHHRIGGPAAISLYRNGKIKSLAYMIDGKYHREDGPAAVLYDNKGKLKLESYYINGMLHNHNGPALVDHKNNEHIYFWYGRQVTREQWESNKLREPDIINYIEFLDDNTYAVKGFWAVHPKPVLREIWMKRDGVPVSINNKPSHIAYQRDGLPVFKEWHSEDVGLIKRCVGTECYKAFTLPRKFSAKF